MVRRAFAKALKEFIFPPFCHFCQERCDTKVFCPECWKLCELPDPAERCRHCFEEIDEKSLLCKTCKKQPPLNYYRAHVFESGAPIGRLQEMDVFAWFAICQWIRLDWPFPDAIIPMPDSQSISFAKEFAKIVESPIVRAIRKGGFGWRREILEDNQDLLVLEVGNTIESLRIGTSVLAESFPKSCHVLSLFHDVRFCIH